MNSQSDQNFIQGLLASSVDLETKKLQSAITQLVFLRLDYTEMACLKTLILFRPGK